MNDADIEQMLKEQFGLKLNCKWEKVIVNGKTACRFIDLEGCKFRNSIIYVDIDLYNGVNVLVRSGKIGEVEKLLVK